MKLSKGKIAVIVVLLVLIIDQVTKIWIKTHMYLGECIPVTSWFEILFVENNGMAFGLEIISKLFLSVFRIVAVIVVGYYLFKIVRSRNISTGYVVCVSLILAGAAGNIIDCLFLRTYIQCPYASRGSCTLSRRRRVPVSFSRTRSGYAAFSTVQFLLARLDTLDRREPFRIFPPYF